MILYYPMNNSHTHTHVSAPVLLATEKIQGVYDDIRSMIAEIVDVQQATEGKNIELIQLRYSCEDVSI